MTANNNLKQIIMEVLVDYFSSKMTNQNYYDEYIDAIERMAKDIISYTGKNNSIIFGDRKTPTTKVFEDILEFNEGLSVEEVITIAKIIKAVGMLQNNSNKEREDRLFKVIDNLNIIYEDKYLLKTSVNPYAY